MSDMSNVIAAFSEEDVERLTGITGWQLRYWVRSLRQREATTVGQIAQHRGLAGNTPVIAGTRIPVKTIKAFRDAGYSVAQIRDQYPVLTDADIRAALKHGKAA